LHVSFVVDTIFVVKVSITAKKLDGDRHGNK